MHKVIGQPRWAGVLAASILTAATGTARAQTPAGDEDLPAITLSGAGVQMLRLAVPPRQAIFLHATGESFRR